MSEFGDSFEEIGLMQSDLNESSSDQESGNLIDSTMRDSTESNSTDQGKTGQLQFGLDWKTRDGIMCSLNEHTKFLSGLIIEPNAKETIRKANGDLMLALLNLPVKADGRSKSSESLGQSSVDRPNDRSNEVLFELSSDARSRIVDTLMTNHNVLEADSVSSEFKSKLVDRNSDLICELVKLRPRIIAVPSDSSTSNGTRDHLIEQPVTGQSASCPVVGEVKDTLKEGTLKEDTMKKELQKIADELSKQISDQSSVIGGLEENVRGLKIKLDESKAVEIKATVILDESPTVSLHESKEVVDEITVTMKLKDIEAVLAGSKKSTTSPNFYCGGIAWFLAARLFVVNGTEYLMISQNFDKSVNRWHAVATFEIRLLSSGSSKSSFDVIRTCKDHRFKNPNIYTGWGFYKFITTDNLRSGSFIQDDTIKLHARLTITSLERLND